MSTQYDGQLAANVAQPAPVAAQEGNGMGFDFSTVPGWAWGIRPMDVVKQTFDYIMDREFEALITEISHQIHCENLTIGFTVIALESLLSQEIKQAV